jgi:hypothetical protein
MGTKSSQKKKKISKLIRQQNKDLQISENKLKKYYDIIYLLTGQKTTDYVIIEDLLANTDKELNTKLVKKVLSSWSSYKEAGQRVIDLNILISKYEEELNSSS